MRDSEFFRHVFQTEVTWSEGSIHVPPFHYDVRSIEADFAAPPSR